MKAYGRVLSTIPALLLAIPVFAQQASGTAVIWHDRGDAAALNLGDGRGGKGREPGTDFRFIEESRSGTSAKFVVEDEHGITWKVKLGEEAKSETAATRLLWAAGYDVDEDYYRPEIRVQGLPRLARGQEFVSHGDTVTGVRLERVVGSEESNTWSWYDNPFVGTREFNGLRVMMALVNNWDLKDVNNGVFTTSDGGEQYGITDLGATFGRTGDSLNRSKGVQRDYLQARFIDKVTPTYVDFVMHSRPFFLSAFNVRNYRMRSRMESVVKHIPIADVGWIGGRLAQLSSGQISDAFRTAGFSSTEVEAYTQAVMRRIAALERLDGVTIPAATETDADRNTKRCLASTCRDVPVRETLATVNLGIPYARAILGGFEQGAGIGGGVSVTSAGAIPAVEFRAAALTSTQGYRRFDLEAFLPRIGGSRNHADVWFSYLRRDIDFFGIGPRTSTDVATQFAMARRSYQGSVSRDLTNHLQGGVYTQIMNARSSPSTDTTGTPIDQTFSSTPTPSPEDWIPGFLSNTQVLSYGAFLAYDTRDNSIGLTRGVNIYGRVASVDQLGHRDALSAYRWVEKEFDARGYAPLGSPRTSLLLRSRAQFKTPKGGSQIPFYDLSWLGGREYLRGYHSYRFRGNNVLLLSTELQQTMLAMSAVRGVDLFASADTGQVWGDARSATDPVILDNQTFRSRNWHSGLGGGLQYRHSRSLAARVEVGRSRERTLIYVSLSRGF
jgi:hypothetical protein